MLIDAARDSAVARRLIDTPEEVFPKYDLSAEEIDILAHRDDRLLSLLAEKPGDRRNVSLVSDENSVNVPSVPRFSLVLTVAPVLVDGALTFAAWVTPLAEGADPDSVPMPEGTQLPGRPLAPLHAVLQISAQQLADAAGSPQVGLSALLLRPSNMTVAAIPESAGIPADPDDQPPDIWIAGLGIATAGQITSEVEQAIRSSREVLYLDTGIATRAVLESLCPRVTSLYDDTYSEDRPRQDGYARIADRVLQAARDHAPVTLAIHGHPLVAATAPFLVMEQARKTGLRVRVLPGVSAIDTVFADLRVDPVVHGMQMYEATDLLLRRRPLQADVPALIWQIGPIETCLHTMRVSNAARYQRLITHLSLFYPPRHEVAAVYCSPHALLPPKILRFAIEDMGKHAGEIHHGFSLYIPPAASRPIEDYDLLGKLNSPEHLRNITGTTAAESDTGCGEPSI